MIKAWSDEAWEDFCYWHEQDKKTLKRILQLIKDIDRNGYTGIGKPENRVSLWTVLTDTFYSFVNNYENGNCLRMRK